MFLRRSHLLPPQNEDGCNRPVNVFRREEKQQPQIEDNVSYRIVSYRIVSVLKLTLRWISYQPIQCSSIRFDPIPFQSVLFFH